MAAITSPKFLRDLLDATAKLGGEKEYAVTSKIEELLDGPSFTISLKLDDQSSEPIYADLLEYSVRHNTEPVLELLVTFSHGFPERPPTFRLLHPVLIPGTGRVLNGNFVIPELFPEGWSRDFTLQLALEWIKDSLINYSARIDSSSYSIYNFQAFKASATRIATRADPRWNHPQTFSKQYFIYSADFAQEVMGLEIPHGFRAGNKILMPAVALHEITSVASPDAPGAHIDGEDDEGEDGAFVFQITSALLFPVFVGVHSFTCPHADIIIVPSPILANMFVPDGSKVALTRVQLPKVESVVVQPHTVNFIAAEAFTGKEPREFLESSFVRYSALQAGDVIICDGGKDVDDTLQSTDFVFNIISVKPEDAPGVAIWAGFATHVPISFIPSMDEFRVPESRKQAAGTSDTGNVTVGELRPEIAAQMFGQETHFSPTREVRSEGVSGREDRLGSIAPVAASTPRTGGVVFPLPAQTPAKHADVAGELPLPPNHVATPTRQLPAAAATAQAEVLPAPPTDEVSMETDIPPAERRRRAAEAARRRAQAAAEEAT